MCSDGPVPRKNRAFKKPPWRVWQTPDGTGPSVHAPIFPDAIIGSSVSHNVDEKKVVFAYQPVSLSEAVPSIFHCRGGFFIIGNSVSHNACKYSLLLLRTCCVHLFPCQRNLCSVNTLRCIQHPLFSKCLIFHNRVYCDLFSVV